MPRGYPVGETIASKGNVDMKGLDGSFGLSVMPSVSILAGRLVVAREGSYHVLRSHGGELSFDSLLEMIGRSYERLHLVDIDSITRGKPQLSMLRHAAETLDVWYDGGFMDSEEIYDPIMMGAESIILGTKSLKGLDAVLDCFELTPNLIFELDYHDGIMSPSKEMANMEISDLMGRVRSVGLSEMVVADFGRMAEGGDLNYPLLEKAMAAGFSVYAAGNVTPSDLPVLKEMGARGAIMKLESVLL